MDTPENREKLMGYAVKYNIDQDGINQMLNDLRKPYYKINNIIDVVMWYACDYSLTDLLAQILNDFDLCGDYTELFDSIIDDCLYDLSHLVMSESKKNKDFKIINAERYMGHVKRCKIWLTAEFHDYRTKKIDKDYYNGEIVIAEFLMSDYAARDIPMDYINKAVEMFSVHDRIKSANKK